MRIGLCCKFKEEPIKFRGTTATSILKMYRPEALKKLSRLCLNNAKALYQAVTFCIEHGIGCFRVTSEILPIKTHPEAGYEVEELPDAEAIIEQFKAVGNLASAHSQRLTFHPSHYTLLSSSKKRIITQSITNLCYHAQVSEWIGADVINIHGGGAYGNKKTALKRVRGHIASLPSAVRSRLTLENDDSVYTPQDLLPLCDAAGVPLVYDVHHHRCMGDELTVEEATAKAIATWNREPLFHLSSPADGWNSSTPQYHHDYINPEDVPGFWPGLDVTVEVEAKAKELAVLRLLQDLKDRERLSK